MKEIGRIGDYKTYRMDDGAGIGFLYYPVETDEVKNDNLIKKYTLDCTTISAEEKLTLDNNWEDIVHKYTQEMVAAKEQALSQYIMKKQQDEIDKLRKDIDNLVAQRKRNEKSRRKQQKAMVRVQNNWNEIKQYLAKQIVDSKAGSSEQYYFNLVYKFMCELEENK